MESIESNEGKEKPVEKQIKEIAEPVGAVSVQASVKNAIDQIDAEGADSAAVTDEGGKLVGTVAQGQLHRNVGGLGHDPKTSPVEPEINKNSPFCHEDQTLAEAEGMLREAKTEEEVPVVNRDKVLVGKTKLGKIVEEQEKIERAKSDG